MRRKFKIAVIAGLLASAATAQSTPRSTQIPNGTAKSSYVSVMSKAGTPTPRPNVPVRNVKPLNGARTDYNYYYGYGRNGYGAGYGYGVDGYGEPRAVNPQSSSEDTLPGYDTRPRDTERKDKDFVNY